MNIANLLPCVLFVCLLTVVYIPSPGSTDDDWVRSEKFRTRKVNAVWEAATKILKGQKLKSLVTELKAHEKLVLTLKKKRHTIDQEIDTESLDGSSAMSRLQEKNRRQAEDELDLERDLERILERYNLNPGSVLYSENDKKKEGGINSHDSHANHMNSVLPSSKDPDVNARKFDEAQVESLYRQAKELSEEVYEAAAHESSESEGKRRKKSFEEWFLALERDLDVMEGRLRKKRFLESELDRYKKKVRTDEKDKYLHHQEEDDNNHLHPHDADTDAASIDDVKQRIKSLNHKIRKSEKEIGDRIIHRRREEFPTSRSEGDL